MCFRSNLHTWLIKLIGLRITAPAERSTKSEQFELTKEAKGEQSYLKSRSNEGKRVGRLANRLDRVGRLFK